MSLSASLEISKTGLLATQRWSQLVSQNIANANDPAYARRTAEFSAVTTSGPATVGVTTERQSDLAVETMHRDEISLYNKFDATQRMLQSYELSFSEPGDATSLSGRLSTLQTSLDQLAAAPSSSTTQVNAVNAAVSLADTVNSLSNSLVDVSNTANTQIQRDVDTLNQQLEDIHNLVERSLRTADNGDARPALEDEISRRLDSLAEMIDLNVSYSTTGHLRLYTAGGTPLLDAAGPKEISYDRVAQTLTAEGLDITPGVSGVRGITAGSLAGNIELVRDAIPRMSTELDSFAAGLISSFEAADASLAAGDPGLFTDNQNAYDAAAVDGLAARLQVNAAVQPALGGESYLMRDGMSATEPGPEGQTDQALAFSATLSGNATFPDVGLGTTASLVDYAADVETSHQYVRTSALAERDAVDANLAAVATLRSTISGVNVDDEMQQLLLIERTYAANSQVITSVMTMMDTLLAAVRS